MEGMDGMWVLTMYPVHPVHPCKLFGFLPFGIEEVEILCILYIHAK